MVQGYDEFANKALAVAKVIASENRRSISVEDLFLGCLAVIDPSEFGISFPPNLQAYLQSLHGKQVQEKVKVEPEVTELDRKLRRKCKERGRSTVTVWDILTELTSNPTPTLRQLSENFGIDLAELYEIAQQKLPALVEPLPASVLEALQSFTINLSEQASQGKLTPAYERDREREQIVRILLRKTKRNVALVGPAGVGKTKLVEDLALRIHRGEIPRLSGCTVLALNLVGLRAGTHVHGELEKRVETFRKALEEHGERIILFIDELHTIVGTYVGGHLLDVANALKPLLASGKIRCIGATTRQEYVQHIEADRALARRFEMVTIQEPSNEAMLKILERVKGEYESHHGVVYPPETFHTILDLCDRFLPMRHYPDKAIDLLDDAGSWASMRYQGTTPITVTPEMVRQVLAEKLGLPAEDLEGASCVGLAKKLSETVIGQDEALERIEQALVGSLVQEIDRDRPKEIFLFIGPPNVGKTLTARTLARHLCKNERAFLEIDLDQILRRYSLETTGVDALIGVRPPYVGWERGGILTNHVLEFPRSVVVVRGLENAPLEVHRLFESIFEKGECEDGRGQKVSFREVIFVLIWETEVQQERPLGFRAHEPEASLTTFDREAIKERLKQRGIPEELLAHIQQIVFFRPLDRQALWEIALRKLEEMKERVFQKEGKLLDIDAQLLEMWLRTERYLPSPAEVEQMVEQQILLPLQELKARKPSDWVNWKVIALKVERGETQLEPIKPRLLVVDDVPDFWEALKETYPEWEWCYAATVEEAEEKISQKQPHLVLVDTCQSTADPKDVRGLEILKHLKTRFPQQTIVMVTSRPLGFDETRQAFKSGAYDYLWKPPEESILRQIVSLLVEREEQERRLTYQQTLLKRYWAYYEVQVEAEGVEVIYKSE
ncbi:MAG: AAA family ATPase [Armatimonadetes bacterium]|nr:AAA family ATPase [Armatimonadota bacterium]